MALAMYALQWGLKFRQYSALDEIHYVVLDGSACLPYEPIRTVISHICPFRTELDMRPVRLFPWIISPIALVENTGKYLNPTIILRQHLPSSTSRAWEKFGYFSIRVWNRGSLSMAFDLGYVNPEFSLWRVRFFLLNPTETVTNLWEDPDWPHIYPRT